MGKSILPCLVVVICFATMTFSAEAEEIVSNSRFEAEGTAKLPDGWSVWKPAWEKAACRVRLNAEGGLLIDGIDPYAVGGVFQEIKNIRGSKAYAIKAVCELRDVPMPYQSLAVRIEWKNGNKRLHPAGMLVRGPVVKDNVARFEDVLVAPEEANAARVTLEVKWLRGGSVIWKEVSMQETPMPKPRNVKVGTVYLRPRNSTQEKNLKLWCDQIDAAGKLGLDIVCLGEVVTAIGTRATIDDRAKPIPGPFSDVLAEAARRNHIWVVAGLTEKVGDVVYNTAVLLDRQGGLAGKYRKVHLPRGEWKEGVRPGHEYPVFETDFGKVAIQICYDWFFPETAEIFALHGAEMIFAPTWGNTLPDEGGRVDGESTFRVRARDNGVYMIPSVYDGNSLVIDPMGRILASNKGKEGVFWAEIDLNTREPLWWVGHWRSIGPRHRMPQTYEALTRTSSP
ncbi:MAG: carbon-nitrogen hydrolase family protein [Sedimentisphaerales bacterium]|nr:carbon-nitrogen hydrolase family protein [Sedimentisphaerales bacterium]